MLGGNDASRSGRAAAEEEAAAAAALPAQSCRGAGRLGAEGGAGGEARAAALRWPGGASPPPAFACRAAWGVAGVLRRRAPPGGSAHLRAEGPGTVTSARWKGLQATLPPLLRLPEDPMSGRCSPLCSGGHGGSRIAHSQQHGVSTCRAEFPYPLCETAVQARALRPPQGGVSLRKSTLEPVCHGFRHVSLKKKKKHLCQSPRLNSVDFRSLLNGV
ncbi:uncharacterized protein LOC121498907 [Vulpes lagopus]|uniref:uncharacterized protein LOC121498907 n=1 Tax=Vulpes lagopus TaxID=494514 RepID=UPI001BC9D772|nr:uncharacterized protein LOC121498907 [Vulpes lagopus]